MPATRTSGAPETDAPIGRPLAHVSAISLFVEDLEAGKAFYRKVFDADVVFEDESSVCVRFDHLFLNLLLVGAAQELVS